MGIRFLVLCASIAISFEIIGQTADDRIIDQLLQKHGLPAISLAVVSGDSISYHAARGVKSLESREPVDALTLFSAASLSKPLFAYIVMRLVEAGRLDLDRPVFTYATYEDVLHDPRHKKVTARMLLSHSAGLPNWRDGDLAFLREPGTRFQYSGEGYVWLMRVVEQITGRSLNELAEDLAFKPLGMTHSSFVWRSDFDNYALPHDQWDEVGPKRMIEEGNSAYSLQTTARDFAQLLIALFAHRGLGAATIAEIGRPQVEVQSFFGGEPIPAASGMAYWGLGWGIQQTSQAKALWQWGDNGPFKAYVVAYPAQEKGLVFFVNHHNGLRLVSELVQHFLGEKSPAFALLNYGMEDPPALRLGKAALRSGFDQAVVPYLAPGRPGLDTALFSAADLSDLVVQLWSRGRPEDVDKLLQAATATYPQAAQLWQQAAYFYLAQGRPRAAQPCYMRARSLAPERFPLENLLLPWRNRVEEANVHLQLEGYEGARLVMLAGSFNDWSPQTIPMIRSKAGWVGAFYLPPGRYGYRFVVDGEWILDPDNEAIIEDGGYTNSLLVVE